MCLARYVANTGDVHYYTELSPYSRSCLAVTLILHGMPFFGCINNNHVFQGQRRLVSVVKFTKLTYLRSRFFAYIHLLNFHLTTP